ncbi:Protein HRI1 [Madurella mycetomatis]|uniref:Protein HRI1 n=1 Tax=Madurella mycetomatis TaxID=100816 RepID=A0A175W7E3_9PEZI|nr:Protein HRI1 [Madurella mycetomatis]
MADISVREHICWPPNKPSEPTSTIVLTSPERRFVDIRILKPTSTGGTSGDILPLSRLDWAIAGTSSTVWLATSDCAPGERVRRSKWHHWIDSRTPNAEHVIDEGDVFAHPSDSSLELERGRMVNPETGVEADYEELWRSEPIAHGSPHQLPGEPPAPCLVLQWSSEEGDDCPTGPRRGLVIRLGQYCQAFVRDGNEITVERLMWVPDEQTWHQQVRIGKRELPTEFATHLAHEARIDDEVKVGGEVWKVVEKA